jgi:phosphopantothenoylcysteine decarboxylase/phosphopantothenate--cysteine ligase
LTEKIYQDWPSLLKGRRLALIVTGGVAAFKAVDLVRRLLKAGAQVRVAMTESATRFVGPLTFEALTHQPCVHDMWKRPQAEIAHVGWAEWAEAMIVAPATANFMAKAAHGLADDFASTLFLAHEGPKLMAPAMNTGMWINPATQANASLLGQRGLKVLAPVCGKLASGRIGPGRLPNPKALMRYATRLLTPKPFAGKTFVVTAGATRESWDDLRYLTNRSTGQMGLALAQAAWLMGAKVFLIAGPALVDPIWSGEEFGFLTVETTQSLLETTRARFSEADCLIMNAAPADFKPVKIAGKIAKNELSPLVMALERTPDVLKTIAEAGKAPHQTVVGFAAESEDAVARAWAKLKDKGLDYVAANQAGGPGSAFGSPNTHIWLLNKNGEKTEIGPGPKFGAAWALLEKLAEDLDGGGAVA